MCKLFYVSFGVDNNITVTTNMVWLLYVVDSIGFVVHVCVGEVKTQTIYTCISLS